MTDSRSMHDAYPNLCDALLKVSYEAGGVNRFRSERQVKGEIENFLLTLPVTTFNLLAVDKWLNQLEQDVLEAFISGLAVDKWLDELEPDVLEAFISGEHDEIQTIGATGPKGVIELFDLYFNEVA